MTAALIAFASVLVLYFVLRRCVPSEWAVGGALVFALGTASWPISSTQLWPHGPGQLTGALLLLALSSSSRLGSVAAGVTAALGVLMRPVTVVVPVVLSLWAARGRRWREAAGLVLPSLAALGVLASYNRWAFGSLSISGGYPSWWRDRLREQSALEYLGNVVDMLVSPQNGMLFWSPVILVCAMGIRHSWTTTPDWARRAAVAGVIYLLVHLRLEGASGGLPYDYRYQLEPLMLSTPALVLGARALVRQRAANSRILVAAIAASLLLQGIVATTFECVDIPGSDDQCSLL